jgi:hypothetical protein
MVGRRWANPTALLAGKIAGIKTGLKLSYYKLLG